MNLNRAFAALAIVLAGSTAALADAKQLAAPAAAKPWRPVATGQALDALAREQSLIKDKAAHAGKNVKAQAGNREIFNITVPGFLNLVAPVKTQSDPLAAKQRAASQNALQGTGIQGAASLNVPSALVSAPGYSSDDNLAVVGGRVMPPDTNGDVDDQYFVQYVNLGWVALNKSDGSIAAGPFAGNTFWAGFGGACETNNAGDPIVIYDHLADRWIFSQFTPIQGTQGHQCFAVSKDGDPFPGAGETAADQYYRYDFVVDNNGFNDYPKIGMWPDGYYMTTNHFNAALTSYTGTRISVFDRVKMLAGNPVPFFVQFDMGTDDTFSMQPVHLEGFDTPPAGTCGLVIHASDAEVFRTAADPDTYRLWRACADFTTPGNSTVVEQPRINAAEFDAELCGFNSCVPQPNGQSLDTLSQFTMYRFTTRYFPGSGLKGVVSHSVDVGADRAGVRWASFDLDTAGTAHSLSDQGTLDPGDSLHRWMPAAGMDRMGNLGLVYTRGNASTFPSVYYTGREAGDAAGVLQPEAACIDGTGSQSGGDRWGDYASMSIDPVDQCTFWMTNEYVETTGTFEWNTRVCSFKFDSCSADPTFTLGGDNLSQRVCTASGAVLNPINLAIGSIQGFNGSVNLSYQGLPAGFAGGFSANPVTAPGASVANVTADSSVATGNYNFGIRGVSGAIERNLSVSVQAFDSVPGAIVLNGPANGAGGQPLRPSFSWTGDAEATGYTIEIATDAGFANIVVTQAVAGTSFTPAVDLVPDTQYFWRVRGGNECGGGANSAVFGFTTGLLYCAAPNLAIPDNATVSDTLNVAGGGTLTDLNVLIKANHTWVGDLIFKLKNVGTGEEIALIDRPGRTTTGFGCSGNNIDAAMDDEGTRAAETTCDAAPPTLNGSLIPNEALTMYDGDNLNGDWTLTVSDNAGGDTGTLVSWCLAPTLAALAGDLNGDRCVDIDDMALLQQAIRARSTDPKYDLNGDGRVNNKDAQKLTTLYTNPGGARCN